MKQRLSINGLYIIVALFLIPHNMEAQTSQSLDAKQQGIVSIAALTATGDTIQLKGALVTGLDVGLTVNEIKEVLVHLYAYCGFPRSLNALNTFIAVMDERKRARLCSCN